MLNWLAKRADVTRKAENLYGAVVAQARQPAFYADFGIHDTLEGRYELIVMHMFLVLEKLRVAAPDNTQLARTLIERFVTDMDDCMRELGVGDLTVPKKVKKAAAGLYERADKYRHAKADGVDALTAALSHVFCAEPVPEFRAADLAEYVSAAQGALEAQELAEILVGQPAWPSPIVFVRGKEQP